MIDINKYEEHTEEQSYAEEKTRFREWIERLLEKVPDDALINCCIEMYAEEKTRFRWSASKKTEIMVTGLHPNDADWQKKYPSSRSCWGGTPLNVWGEEE